METNKVLLFIVGMVIAWFGFVPSSQATMVFINEIHYDNAGTDAGEAIEVAGPAGISLDSYSLVLYNGATGSSYTTTPLSGIIPNQSNGYGTISFSYPVNGIQNGSPDGIVLVNAVTVIQFLSYEGTFVAIDGPANGFVSTDIGVSETGAEPVGFSLMLTGTGNTYEDFLWIAPLANTFGAINTNQSFEPSQPVPEPSTFVLLGAGLAGLAAMGVRRKKS